MGSMHMNAGHHANLLWRFDRGLVLKEAVLATVQPGDFVIDAGCGTGLLALWAAKAGAKKVLAIDFADVSMGRALAEENQVADRIEFIRADLTQFELPTDERSDVLLAMVYFNDPRRDAAQSKLTCSLREKVLKSGGKQIPDRVVYTAAPLEWHQQDLVSRLADVDKKVSVMEERYDLSLGAIREGARQFPDRSWYPQRREDGLLDRGTARILSPGHQPLATINYAEPYAGYPAHFQCAISQPGVCNAILFTQALYAGKRLVFSNESLSWVREPQRVEAGMEIRFALDDEWFGSNVGELECE